MTDNTLRAATDRVRDYMEAHTTDNGETWTYKGIAYAALATPAREGLDVRRLAFAIAAAEGGDGWTPWASETTNAELIAEKYGGLTNVHTHHPECPFCQEPTDD